MTSAGGVRQYGAVVTEPASPKALVRPALVGLLVAVGLLESLTVDPESSPRSVVVLCTLAATSLMSLWWRFPEVSAAAAIGAIAVKDAYGGPGEMLTLLLCGVLSMFGVGARLPALRATCGLAGLLALAAVGVLAGPESAASELVFSAIAIGLPWGAGRLLRASRQHAAVLQELADSREREAGDQVRLAIADERSRIAREVHDLVGHSVSTMILQAGAAEEVLGRRPDDALGALRAVQATGRGALDDLHRVLGLLHPEPEVAGHAPVPGLDRLPELLATFGHARLDVHADVPCGLSGLPDGVSLAAYRIVQEALTNVARHAGVSEARLTIERSDEDLHLVISDEGRGSGSTGRVGQGLIGIRQRVAMYDGAVSLGPAPGGGYRVDVRLPLGNGS